MFYETKNTRTKIIKATTELFAMNGYNGFTMRNVAKKATIAPSVLYYYFKDKDSLLKTTFDEINTELGKLRSKLSPVYNASDMLFQRIDFQLTHAAKIVTVLKYYLTFRKQFKKNTVGFVPDKAYLHIEEVIRFGVKTKEFAPLEIKEQAKVITHAINGFILEYYPEIPENKERQKLIKTIHKFIFRAIRRV